MFEDKESRQTFLTGPQSVRTLAAAVLEPALSVFVYLAINGWYYGSVNRADMTLCLLVFALSFPGRDRFREGWLPAGIGILTDWVFLLLILALCGFATRSFGLFDEEILIAWAILTPLTHWAMMWIGRSLLRAQARKPEAVDRAVIVGAGTLGVKLANSLAKSKDRVTDVLGHFDDRTNGRVAKGAEGKRLGSISEVAAYVNAHGVRSVYITLPLGSQPRILQLMEQLQGTTASLYFVPDVFGISIIQGRLRDVGGIPVVGLCETPFTGTSELVKRISDIVLASIILLLISPLMLAIALGVKMSSPGPVIFKQRRNGLDGEEIIVYKFRSMTTMDNGSEIRQATKGDARITPFGAFIRRTSLDELPQFINVLQGRMSIVGPRPHAVAHNETYRQLIKAYMVRHKVKPGITGLAQVNGHRGETDTIEKMQVRVEHDLEYLRNWSLLLDLQIILATIRLVVRDSKAY
ncbi:undecaprenyl-phosphate glucose phosphotransferase [Piscinibacter sakaiensis]|uniref:undecaprenyl-phosphate glucose phosphotransferase n=1 Tax=Piscinibacter sakaiensis TaxID=1547922 RepID=UPI003AAC9F26